MKAVTASRLSDGAVIYLKSDGLWALRLADAAQFSDADAAEALAKTATRVTEIAGAYLIDVDPEGRPVGREALREKIRRAGPTVRMDLNRA